MKTVYDAAAKATLLRDAADRLRAVTHVDDYPVVEAGSASAAALEYLQDKTSMFALAATELDGAQQHLSFLDPRGDHAHEFRLREEKSAFDTATVAFNQTWLNLPVWEAGLTVTLKRAPWRALGSTSTVETGVDAKMPSTSAIERFKALFAHGEKLDVPLRGPVRDASPTPDLAESAAMPDVASLLGSANGDDNTGVNAAQGGRSGLIRGRFYVYRYDPEARLDARHGATPDKRDKKAAATEFQGDDQPLCGTSPRFPGPIPPLDPRVEPGRWYVVAELVFRRALENGQRMNWRALVEVETGAILYLRALTSGITAQVFHQDPITSSGNAALTPNQNAATLNPSRSSRTLNHLNAPLMGANQALSGTRTFLTNLSAPNVAAPTEPGGGNFNYGSRTNDFAAANAYYHTDRFFDLVENLGFALGTFFDGTTFPIETDHRGLGDDINAQCIGDGDGIDFHQYALADASDTANPIGIASDWRVVLHELAGHGILYDHVNRANFGAFTNANGALVNRCHSMGDSFAMVLNDPTSAWHGGAAIDRFILSPFVPAVPRRSDRTVAAGWGWGGAQDLGNYSSEQILSTTMFRFYRSVGGDSTDLGRREFAGRLTAYLMLRAVSTLTPVSNPNTPEGILAALIAADQGDWTSEGLAGGAYKKVLSWAFERQNLNNGARPAVDVYIDDGRGGEYGYQPIFWQNASVWNRQSPDGDPNHQEAVTGATNYAYCKVKNRGTSTATNVVVRGFHCLPSAGVTWPVDLQPMTTAMIAVPNIAANNSEERIVGPFSWTPNANAWGHDCIFLIASATGDPSNIDNLSAGEVFADWRLVPHDNNIGQRNVTLVAAGATGGMLASLKGKGFWLGNPGRRVASMEVAIQLPDVMLQAGWRMSIAGLDKARFEPGERRLVTYDLVPGSELDRDAIKAAGTCDIVVTATADGAIVGGMIYRLDADLDMPVNERPADDRGKACRDKAQDLLECLDLGSTKARRVRVRKVAIDIEMDDGDCCS
jgi:zinc metalloprotease ZmpB